MKTSKLKGIVKWFSPENGFGFIESEQEETGDIFVEYSSILMDGFKVLNKGQKVEFELDKDDRGSIAKKVMAIKRHL
ncbi:MAG: cold shock domain-containing protein [Elusimicrobia bacterium]|nr:cold shock domain-containing protein [Elusimicrobiota bacterium]